MNVLSPMLSMRKRKSIAARSAKKTRTYRLPEKQVEAARRILGVETGIAAIETALDMVVFREELIQGTRAMAGLKIEPLFEPE